MRGKKDMFSRITKNQVTEGKKHTCHEGHNHLDIRRFIPAARLGWGVKKGKRGPGTKGSTIRRRAK